MSKVERTTLGCVFHLIIHLEQNQEGGCTPNIHSSLFSRNILYTYIDGVRVTCVVIRRALFSLCIFPGDKNIRLRLTGHCVKVVFFLNI